jgi:hypothetical protein
MGKIRQLATRVRPIRKIFIVDEHDISTFKKIIRASSSEIAGVLNLIFSTQADLVNDNTRRFIMEYDPDVIINTADKFDPLPIARMLRTPLICPTELSEARAELSAHLMTWNNVPLPFRDGIGDQKKETVSVLVPAETDSVDGIAVEEADIFAALHLGIVSADFADDLKSSAFDGLKISPATTKEQVLEAANDPNKSILLMSLGLSSASGHGSSVFAPDDNQRSLFDNKPTLIFGSMQSVSDLSYFWNMRATYPFNRTIFVPLEIIDELNLDYSTFKHFAVTRNCLERLPNNVREQLLHAEQIDASVYYFKLHINWWQSFEESSVAYVDDNGKVVVTHPREKLFSTLGYNLNYALDIMGLAETAFPRSADAGKLFFKEEDQDSFDFPRTAKGKITVRVREFNPLQSLSYSRSISLPSPKEVFTVLLAERGIKLTYTAGTDLLQRTIELLGGEPGLSILSNRKIFDLLVRLTPKRLSRITKELESALPTELPRIIERELAGFIANMPTLPTTGRHNAADLLGMLGGGKETRPGNLAFIQDMHNRGMLLRGKSFACPHCHFLLWLPLSRLPEELRCYGCGLSLQIPVDPQTGGQDYYRLNELLALSVDQGVLPVALTVSFLQRAQYLSHVGACDLETSRMGGTKAEADLIFAMAGLLGFAEIKADRGFDLIQAERLLRMSKESAADVVLFSTLKSKTSSEVSDLAAFLKERTEILPSSVLILTSETLFTGDPKAFWKYLTVQGVGSFRREQISIVDV